MNTEKNKSGSYVGISLSCLLALSSANAASLLVNSGFEQATPGLQPQNYIYTSQATMSPWQTTASDGLIEVWSTGFNPEGVQFNASTGTGVRDGGNQFVEINATQASTLYQSVDISSAGSLDFYFLHRGRGSASIEDILKVTITYLGGESPMVVYEGNFGATNAQWELHEAFGVFEVTPETFGTYQFAYTAISSANGNQSYGNFIDNVGFGVNIPEPSTALLSVLGAGFLMRRRRI